MIEDAELRNLFRAESEEHLQILEDGLLLLEEEPANTGILENLFRSAHSLKGAARMLGVADLESLAHHFESELGAARHGHRAMSSQSADRLYHGLDAMRMLALEACGGEASAIDMPSVMARLRGEEVIQLAKPSIEVVQRLPPVETAPETKKVDHPKVQSSPATIPVEVIVPVSGTITDFLAIPGETLSFAPLNEDAALHPASYKIETIRVDPSKLDALMTLAGEISITTKRVARSLSDIGGLAELLEEWNRETNSAQQAGRLKRMGALLNRLENAGGEGIGRLERVANDLNDSVRDIRLLPLSTIFNLFPRLVRDLSHGLGKEVRLEIEGGMITADKHLLEEIKDPLMHMIRNAVDHGVELPDERERRGKPREATVWLRATRTTTHMAIEITDDGRGLDENAIRRSAIQKGLVTETELAAFSSNDVQRLIFAPGFTTALLITDLSGRGVGLDVVRTNVERLKGSITIESKPGIGSTFRILAPISLVTARVMLVQVGQRSYALPIESVQETFLVPRQRVFFIEGRPAIEWLGKPVRVAKLSEVLGISSIGKGGSAHVDHMNGSPLPGVLGGDLAGVLISVGSSKIALLVDALMDEQEVILRPFRGLLTRVNNILGSTMLTTGEICMVLNPQDLVKSLSKQTSFENVVEANVEAKRKKLILIAEDSITTRTQEKRILEAAGYEVIVSVDGLDAFSKLSSRTFDAVVSDIEMPNMTGLELTARIREDSKYVDLPIILVTSLATDEDRRRGIELGANAYITKGAFDQKLLIETLGKLV